MSRPSKLTDAQWAEAARRHIKGEPIPTLAREYKVGIQTMRDRISVRTVMAKELAKQIVEVEQRFEALPVSVQVSVRNLADDLKSISNHLAGAATYGAMTAHRLAGIANARADMIDDADPTSETSIQTLKGINALMRTANEAADTGIKLLQANKDQLGKGDPNKPIKTLNDFYRTVAQPVP